ncbi:MAG: CYTH domain-containing protein [Candidatus Kerfeldbacteria bacterium]|nr:CYTH domain-containing protein [Candidatus Kerfeldbacteria bacterium]
MEVEVEAKFPGVDPAALRSKLQVLGAVRVHPEVLMRRKVFDYPDLRLRKIGGWARVRDEGSQVTMSYKQLDSRTLHGTKEVTVLVDSFTQACDFLTALGLRAKSYQETKREAWRLRDVAVTIDSWPWIPTFVELEGSSEAVLRQAAVDLGLDWSAAMHGSVEPVYQMHYRVTEVEIDGWESVTFTPVPDWLRAKIV